VARRAGPAPRFGPVAPARPRGAAGAGPPGCIAPTLVGVEEVDPPAEVGPARRRLSTARRVSDAEAARRVVGRYEARWTVERLVRILERQGLEVEAGRVGAASRPPEPAAIAARAAAPTPRPVRARAGRGGEPAAVALDAGEAAALEALAPRPEGGTAARKNPRPVRGPARAARIVARLGGRDGCPSSRPPGPITSKRGPGRFRAIVEGWRLPDVGSP
jgi:hypothetical protein